MSKKVVTVDVRDDLRQGREPFAKIMQAVTTLKEGQQLLLIAPFEPKPLFGVLAQRGYTHEVKSLASGDYEILFTPGREAAQEPAPVAAPAQAPSGAKPAPRSGTPVVDVDARGLEPPQPLVTILEAVAALPEGAQLRAHTDRRPMHLYAHLEERGMIGETEEQEDGSFITYVRRR